jgi:hypothetical protein
MQLKGATTVIKKQSEFLGLTIAETLKFADESPLAQPLKLLEAIKVVRREARQAERFFKNNSK